MTNPFKKLKMLYEDVKTLRELQKIEKQIKELEEKIKKPKDITFCDYNTFIDKNVYEYLAKVMNGKADPKELKRMKWSDYNNVYWRSDPLTFYKHLGEYFTKLYEYSKSNSDMEEELNELQADKRTLQLKLNIR